VNFSITQYGLFGDDIHIECCECHKCRHAFASVQRVEVQI
jgi:hypothetical protein